MRRPRKDNSVLVRVLRCIEYAFLLNNPLLYIWFVPKISVMEQEGAVLMHRVSKKSGEYVNFRAAIPKDIAVNALGLKVDVPKQRLVWKLEKGKVVVGKNESRFVKRGNT